MRTLKLAILGAGNVAESYIRQIRRLREEGMPIELAAICSRRSESAAALAERFGIESHGSDWKAVLNKPEIVAVLILTPMPLHHAHVREALLAGKHVLVEKTMAPTARQGRELASLAQERERRLVSAPFTVLSPAFRKTAGMIDAGDIGTPLQCRSLYGWQGPDWADWFYEEGAGPLRDLGVYGLTTLTGLLGPVTSVFAQADEPPDDFQLALKFANGCLGSVTTSFGIQKYKTAGIEIYGSEGTLQFMGQDWDPQGIEVWTKASSCWRIYETPSWPWTDGVRDFCRSIIEDAPPENSLDHAIHVLDIIDQALLSAKSGKMEPVSSSFAPLTKTNLHDDSHSTHNPLLLT